jgi:hypothetical protein
MLKEKSTLDKKAVKYLNRLDELLLPLFNKNKPKISKGLSKMIYKIYENNIQKLENLLKVDLSSWKYV